MTSRQSHHKNLPIETIQSGSGLPTTTADSPVKNHDGTMASMAAEIPMSLTNAEQLIRQKKIAATSGDLFMTGRDFRIEKMK